MESAGLRRIDTRPIDIPPGEILCAACVRNESLRLPHFLDYHRRLGVARFLIVDNGSDDGTTESLLAQDDVHVFFTTDRYSTSEYGMAWLNAVLAAHAAGHWTLTVDADELLVYPSCEEVNLRRLGDYLSRRREEALPAFLLDMYGDKPIRETAYSPGEPFLESCPFFDGDGYAWSDDDRSVPSSGGPRARLFFGSRPAATRTWVDRLLRRRQPPFLPKIPFVRWRPGLVYTSSTHALPGVRLSKLTGALLHFKFFSDFAARAEIEGSRREHWNGASEYVAYRKALRRDPNLRLMYGGSVRYQDSQQLVRLGLAKRPEGYPAGAAVDDE